MCVLIADDLTYACKNTEVAGIYWIFWKQGATSVINCVFNLLLLTEHLDYIPLFSILVMMLDYSNSVNL